MDFRNEIKYFEEHGEEDPDAAYDRMREDREIEREEESERERIQREHYQDDGNGYYDPVND